MDIIERPQKVYIVGKGIVYELGNLSAEEINNIKNMSKESQQLFINEKLKDIHPAFKEWFGFCTKTQKHVKPLDCIRCGRYVQLFSSVEEWEVCKTYYLSKP